MAGFQSLKIDLDLKKKFTPFIPVQEKVGQPFSFSYQYGDGVDGKIKICPNWFYSNSGIFSKDISTKLIFGMDDKGEMQKHILHKTLFDYIPKIQIREYQQDSRLNQVFSLLGNLVDGFNDGKSDEKKGGIFIGDGMFYLNGIKLAWKIFQKVIADPMVIINELKGALDKTNRTFSIKPDIGDKYLISVIKFPHRFYYELLATKTLNYYSLPYNGSFTINANGDTGWNSGHKGGIQGGDGILGGIANFIGVKQLNVTTTPTWDGVENAESTTVECQLDLFNDSVDAACQNFIFVNTILPAAMYTQYHIFQQSPSLFDIKVDGLGRFFMCTGNFKVEFKGVVRTPSKEVFTTLVSKHLNPTYNITEETLRIAGVVKIPDVYHISLTFKSLLPNNLNNFIYSMCCGDLIENLKDSPSVWKDISNGLETAFSKIKENIKNEENEKLNKAISESGLGGSAYEVIENGGKIEQNGDGYKVTRVER